MHSKTRFGQLLHLLPRADFDDLVDQYQADKHVKGFSSWSHLGAMIFGQLSPATSLRSLATAYSAHSESHYHLGVCAVKRSTLADANAHRDHGLFAALCRQLLSGAHRGARKESKELLYLLDASPILLRGRGHDWAQSTRTRRITGLKLHLLFAPDAGVPCKAEVGPANENDITYAKRMHLESAAMYVFDRGYYDYNWWYKIDQCGSYFVTRFKDHAGVEVVDDRPLTGCGDHIVSDQEVRFKHRLPGGKRVNRYYGQSLRKVTVWRENHNKPLVIATNDMARSADEIAALYKQRWDIELYFKWIKQRLKIKRFLGRSENAVKIQVYVALIVYLLLHRYRTLSGETAPFYLWLVAFKSTLFGPDNAAYREGKRRDLRYHEALARQVEIQI